MKLFLLCLALLISYESQAFAFGRKAVQPDLITKSSILDGDATGLVEGCGQQPSSLGVFCRMVEGDAVDKSVSFIGPPAQCDRPACVFIQVYNNQGTLVFGNSIPKGSTRVTVPWSTLLGRQTVALNDRGFWTFNTVVYWRDPDGREENSTSQGDIVLRVYKQGYVPLNNVADDPNFVWSWVDGKFLYKMTAGLRAFVGKATN